MPMWFRFSNSRVRVGLAAAMMALGSSGCGTGDFVPPPPPELRGAVGVGSPGMGSVRGTAKSDLLGSAALAVKGIEVILNGDVDLGEVEVQKAAARTQAGYDRAQIQITVPGEVSEIAGKSVARPKSQAALVRDALARHPHPQVLIVEPANPADPDLAQAVQEAGAAKVPVILVGRPLSGEASPQGASSGPSPILVAPSSFTPSARQLVAAAIRNAKSAKLKPEEGAILLINSAGDAFIPDRVAAIRDALKAAGVNSIQEVRFAQDSQLAQKLLTERLKADPKPVLVFSLDFMGATGSNEAAGRIAEERPFIQAGYTSEDHLLRMADAGEFAALGFYIPVRLIRKAVSLAVAVALKKEVPKSVEIPIEIHESPANTGAPQVPAHKKSQMRPGASTP
jgi:ABC-type sugar transport system substrate-binding protein